MEFQATHFRPLVDSQAELAPYLAGLNVTEALQDFGRLADMVLATEDSADQQKQQQWPSTSFNEQQKQVPMMATSSYGNSVYSYMHESASPGSPGGASLYSSATATSSLTNGSLWSQALSPLGSDHSSFSYSSSSSCSAFSSSAESSICGDLDFESQPASSPRRRSSSRRAQHESGDRKRQNATAAERYRRRQKGRRSGLDDELERERARNSKLLQSFEAKLELYREFADLLAANTRDPGHDLDLARLGSRSLENILEHICPAQFLAANGRQRVELERLQEHFRRMLGVAQFEHQA